MNKNNFYFIIDKPNKDSYFTNKSILKSNNNNNYNAEIEEQNYFDRQHLIRFTGDNSANNNNNNV